MTSVPPQSGEIFTGNINKFNRATLARLCAALQLNVTGKGGKNPVKEDYLAAAKERVFVSGKNCLGDNPHFAGIQEGSRKSGTVKTSAHKAAEDLAEQSKNQAPVITGANLKLRKMGITTDPVGQTRLLKSGAAKPSASGASRSSSLTALADTDGGEDNEDSSGDERGGHEKKEEEKEEEEEEEEEEEAEGKPKGKTASELVNSIVLLKMTNSANPADIAEAFVPGMKITKTSMANGTTRHEVDLRELVPVALQDASMSPIKKDLSGKISRPGFSAHSKMVLGKVKDFVLPRQPDNTGGEEEEGYEQLKARVNIASLDIDRENEFFSYSLFFQPSEQTGEKSSSAHAGPSTAPVTSLTGAGSDRPKDIANARKNSSLQSAAPESLIITDQSLEFIRLLARATDTLVKKIVRSDTAADALVNFREFDTYFQKFKEFTYGKSGYLCSSNYKGTELLESNLPNWRDHCDKKFTKEAIIKAAGLGRTSTNDLHTVFNKGLKLRHSIAEYLKHGGTDSESEAILLLEAEYADMSYNAFTSLIQDLHEDANSHKPQVTKGKGKAKQSVKRGRASSVDAGDDDDAPKEKRRKKSKDGKRKGKEYSKLVEEFDGCRTLREGAMREV
ncbi:hypothetical protein R3P38DRAFT_3524541 [Favolaschia claudopus]|uniref:Uncharacterized protein n=1 Tax=Favolaschia claudopus TaxID=2862362 RepID=A0AAW0BK61_9AGAR